MIYEIKRLFGGIASIRDYIVETAILNNEDLIVKFKGKMMTLTPKDLKEKQFQIIPSKFKSKINPDQEYSLIDFQFIPDDERKRKVEDKQLNLGFKK